jgi:hypothetical protein
MTKLAVSSILLLGILHTSFAQTDVAFFPSENCAGNPWMDTSCNNLVDGLCSTSPYALNVESIWINPAIDGSADSIQIFNDYQCTQAYDSYSVRPYTYEGIAGYCFDFDDAATGGACVNWWCELCGGCAYLQCGQGGG